jgi:hypothetical protein
MSPLTEVVGPVVIPDPEPANALLLVIVFAEPAIATCVEVIPEIADVVVELMLVLHPNPVLVVQISALEEVEQEVIANAVGEAVPLVALPKIVFVVIVDKSANVTSPVAVNAVVTVRLGADNPLGRVEEIAGTPVPEVIKTPLFAVAKFPRLPALSYNKPLLVPLAMVVVPIVKLPALAEIVHVLPMVQVTPLTVVLAEISVGATAVLAVTTSASIYVPFVV